MFTFIEAIGKDKVIHKNNKLQSGYLRGNISKWYRSGNDGSKVEINNEYIALDFPDFPDFSGFNKIRKIWKIHHTICNFALLTSRIQSTHNETIA